MVFEKIKFLAANIAPKPDETTYWVDISANPYGGVIKYWDGHDWIKLDQDSIAEDYLKLRNKPTLNGVVIEGNKTSADYNIPTPESVELVLNDFRNEINNIDEKVSNVSIKLDNYIETNEGNIEDIKQDIVNIQESLELILGESASEVIDKFNEILSFLEGYDDSQTLKGVISDLEEMINDAEDDISLLEKEIKAALDSHINDYNNPHLVTKEQVGLDQVDNTSDLNKPISTLTQLALDYEANLRDEMDTELMNRINDVQYEVNSTGIKLITDITDVTLNETSGIDINYKYKTRASVDEYFGDDIEASVNIPNATSTNHGLMGSVDKKLIDSLPDGILTSYITITKEEDSVIINNRTARKSDGVYDDGGTLLTRIPGVTATTAGVMSAADKRTLDAVSTTYIPLTLKGVANGVATLDENGLVPSNQLPSFVDDVIDCYATYDKAEDGTLSNILLYSDENHEYEIVGESGKIYVDITGTNSAYQFRWTGTQFAVVGAPTVIGEVTGTAFDGARGKALEDKTNAHIANKNNPHEVTVTQIGAIPTGGLKTINGNSLEGTGNIEIVIDKEIAITDGEEPQGDEVLWVDMNEDTSSSLEELGIQPKLESGVNIKTINGESILGEGDITIEAGTSINVVQTTGTSEVDVISQKTVTDELNKKIEDAPSDGFYYTRRNGKWVRNNDNLAIIEIDQTISDPATMISGDVNNGAIQWIRKNSHRVLAKKTGEGTITYIELDDNNSNKYAYDGSEAKTDGTEGDVFVKLPTFYYKGTEGDNVKLYFSLSKIDDSYVEWDTNTLIGAYEAYYEDHKLYSRSGVESSGNASKFSFKYYVQSRGKGYQLVDWQMHCVLGCLFYAMYGNTNSQAICGSGTSSYTKTCGETNILGMNDTKAETNGNTMSINFWGLENWWGNKYEWMEGIETTAANTVQILSPDPSSGRSFTWYGGSGYGKHYRFGKYLDLSNDVTKGGSNRTYYCDYNCGPSFSDIMVRRSYYGAHTDGGVSYAYAYYNDSYGNANIGSRLAFRGVCTKAESVEAFKSLPVL